MRYHCNLSRCSFSTDDRVVMKDHAVTLGHSGWTDTEAEKVAELLEECEQSKAESRLLRDEPEDLPEPETTLCLKQHPRRNRKCTLPLGHGTVMISGFAFSHVDNSNPTEPLAWLETR